MNVCAYCGRENDDALTHCGGCGTKLLTAHGPPAEEEEQGEGEQIEQPTSAFINLGEVAGAVVFEEGFSRPDWDVIRKAIESVAEPEERGAAWDEAVSQWVFSLAKELGGTYRARRSRHSILLSPTDRGSAHRLLSFVERATEQIRDFLGEVAWGSFQGIHLVLLFSEEDDYYQYISAFYPEGTHPTTSGVHLSAGFPHIAALHYSELQSAQIIAHELAHHCLSHLSLPRWLDEGVAMTLERAIGRSHRPVLPDDLPERHHQFWNEGNIQGFWAGTSFGEPGESVELSYSLADVLVQLLPKDHAAFLAFLRSADYSDAGQTAALDCLGVCLGEMAGTFLGPGNWRPQRAAIKRCWQAAREVGGSSATEEGEAHRRVAQ